MQNILRYAIFLMGRGKGTVFKFNVNRIVYISRGLMLHVYAQVEIEPFSTHFCFCCTSSTCALFWLLRAIRLGK